MSKDVKIEVNVAGVTTAAEALRKAMRDKVLLNSFYGRGAGRPIIFDEIDSFPTPSVLPHLQMYGRGLRVPHMYPGTQVLFRHEQVIPALEVPEAPREPEPVVEPESASVQMLRKLLADRRAELATAEQNCADTKVEIEDTKRMLADEEAELASHERHVAAAKASIEQVLADIKALGGRDEGDSIRG